MNMEPKKILVCDDQPTLRMVLGRAILDRTRGYEVVEASNGAEAEELLQSQEFKVAFLDVEMPKQDGFTTLQNIRKNHLSPGVKIVMCTGRSDEADLLKGWQLRTDYYLTKPFDLDEVKDVLEDIERAAI